MGHLTHIANNVVDSMEKGPNADRLKELYKGKSTVVFPVINIHVERVGMINNSFLSSRFVFQ
jgi:hypothetical protein